MHRPRAQKRSFYSEARPIFTPSWEARISTCARASARYQTFDARRKFQTHVIFPGETRKVRRLINEKPDRARVIRLIVGNCYCLGCRSVRANLKLPITGELQWRLITTWSPRQLGASRYLSQARALASYCRVDSAIPLCPRFPGILHGYSEGNIV